MTRDDIIRMAREAGMVTTLAKMGAASVVYTDGCDGVAVDHLSRFAALVAEAERERIAAEFDRRNTGTGFYEPHEPAEIVRAREQT